MGEKKRICRLTPLAPPAAMKGTIMKRLIILILTIILTMPFGSYAEEGEMGHMGGVSSGSNLPKTIEKYVEIPSSTTNTYVYKEVVFLSSKPVVFEGTIEVSKDTSGIETSPSGSYTESYEVTATNAEISGELKRNISFITYYRMIEGEFKKQVVTTSNLSSWSEVVTVEDATYTLDNTMSSFTMAGVTDMTPGVNYFETSLSYVARYVDGDGNPTLLTASGSNYGYSQPWSKIETQNRKIEIDFPGAEQEDLAATTESVLEAKKTIYYAETEPFPISFDGTYNQRMERSGTLSYEVLTYHKAMELDEYQGEAVVYTANQIEKLPIPENLDFIEGHWAEEDIKKLYSLEIFTDLPHQGMQYEAINRGDYVKALCLAMNIDVTGYMEDDEVIFGDVQPDHPLYPYVMAAYDKKLVKGTGENFEVDRPINREEAFVIYIRVIGLERLGITEAPVTPFVDDNKISGWAKKEIMAGYKLGIIEGDNLGQVKPQHWISKAEAAAIINRLVDYLREDIGKDYRR